VAVAVAVAAAKAVVVAVMFMVVVVVEVAVAVVVVVAVVVTVAVVVAVVVMVAVAVESGKHMGTYSACVLGVRLHYQHHGKHVHCCRRLCHHHDEVIAIVDVKGSLPSL
jgi:hypothetical protein